MFFVGIVINGDMSAIIYLYIFKVFFKIVVFRVINNEERKLFFLELRMNF